MHDPNHKEIRSKSPSIPLTARSLDLLRRALSSLLSHNSSNLSLCCRGSTLRLLSLLRALCCGTLLLALLDCGCAGSGTGFGSLRSTLLDYIERGTDDSTLRLDCAARSLLGNFLLVADVLAPRSSSHQFHLQAPDPSGCHTSEIPFLCCLRKRTVQAMRRGFLRWRKRDSVFPFWNRKILLSPRT